MDGYPARLVVLMTLLISMSGFLGCTGGDGDGSGEGTCEEAVAAFLDHAARMAEELAPSRNPSQDVVEEQADEAEELRRQGIETCGGEAAFLEEMSRQRSRSPE